VIKGGKTDTGKQRYRSHPSFLLDSAYKSRSPEIKQQVSDLSLNGSGVRDTARVLGISPTTVLNELKKMASLSLVNQPLIERLLPSHVEVVLERMDDAEVDEMWSFVGKKKTPRWLWHALDHRAGEVLAYVFGRREDQAFLKLKALLAPFGITRCYTDGWGAYQRHVAPALHEVGKHHTQQLERKHLTLRTRIERLVRKTTRSFIFYSLLL